MAAVGPVCHIPPKNNTAQPGPAELPGIPGPATTSLQSLQSTVNQLRNIIIVLTGQHGAQGPPGQNAQTPPASAASFTQKTISYTTTKIFQNNDPSTGNFVEVQTVQNLVMQNKQGATWTYTAPPPQQNQ
jgi:hypothetical protein